MRFVSYFQNGAARAGVLSSNGDIIPLPDAVPDLLTLIEMGEAGLALARVAAEKAEDGIALESVTLRAPLPRPRRNVMCLGKNYAAHAEESNRAWGDKVEIPDSPVIFTKATTAVNGPYDEIPYDAAVSTNIDFEAELAVIIGRDGINISPENALEHVFGYTVMNDITARDLQRQHKQFFKGKSLDGSAPMGPWIVTRDEIENVQDLTISCTVNGVLKQESSTRLMIFDVVETLVQLSRGMTLLAGDIVATGTPEGVGFARTPPEYLQPGDEVVCTVESVGTIRNRIAG